MASVIASDAPTSTLRPVAPTAKSSALLTAVAAIVPVLLTVSSPSPPTIPTANAPFLSSRSFLDGLSLSEPFAGGFLRLLPKEIAVTETVPLFVMMSSSSSPSIPIVWGWGSNANEMTVPWSVTVTLSSPRPVEMGPNSMPEIMILSFLGDPLDLPLPVLALPGLSGSISGVSPGVSSSEGSKASAFATASAVRASAVSLAFLPAFSFASSAAPWALSAASLP